MTQEAFKEWWHNEGSQAPYTHHDCEEHTMRMCEIAWANGAYKEREACAKVCEDLHHHWRWGDGEDSESGPKDCAAAIRARGEA